MTAQRAALIPLFLAWATAIVPADDARNAEVESAVREFLSPGSILLPIGVTSRGTLIWCVAPADALLPSQRKLRSVIVAGLDGDPEAVAELATNRQSPLLGRDSETRARAWIPIAHPDAWYDRRHSAAAPPPLRFPPQGPAYHTAGEVEAAVLSRFVEWFAPDAVIEIRGAADPHLQRSRERGSVQRDNAALAAHAAGRGDAGRLDVPAASIPVNLLAADSSTLDAPTRDYINLSALSDDAGHSRTATHAIARLQRSPDEVVQRLLNHYGHNLERVMYQPALALVARLEFAERSGDAAQAQAVRDVLEPWLSGDKAALPEKWTGSHLAGHLVFAAWASRAGAPSDARGISLVRRAADQAFDADGRPLEAMPTHNEMSDAVFMACPILTAAGRLTGEEKYFDMAGRHFEFMQTLCLREDGLYRHSPLCEAPWGRGNGFPALGLAMCLSDLEPTALSALPAEAARAAARLRGTMLAAFDAHLRALLDHQDPSGAWRQVIDHPGAYRELTATCMITFAMARGVRLGWLDEATFAPAIDRAWDAIQLRVYDDGVLIDVCTGTGKQKTLRDYLDREAILGPDERGGAMALLAALEMARYRER
jgi:hypothetical protein